METSTLPRISTSFRYSVLVEDPAWPQAGGGVSKRGADRHYTLMTVKDIVNLPVYTLAERDAHYWIWATDNHLADALSVMNARGFRFVRTFVWVKTKAANSTDLQIGLGQYGRNAHEFLLFGTKGKAFVPLPENRPDSVFYSPKTAHSTKPEKGWQIIEAVSRPGRRLELNARVARPGWDCVGNELGVSIEDFTRNAKAEQLARLIKELA